MAIADSSRFQLRYVEEATWGTTPASALKNFRCTSANLKQVNQTVVSDELRSDRQITDLVRVGVSATASVSFEMSYGTLDDFLEGALSSDWTTDTGFSGALSGTDLLANGTTVKSYSIEGEFANITQFLSLTGCRINSLSLSMRTGSIVTGTMEFMGKIAAIGATTVGTGAATAATTTDVISSVNLSGVLQSASAVELLGIDLTINNGTRAQQVLGTTGLKGVGLGRFNVTGSMEAYFEDSTIIADYLAHTASSLDWTLGDAAGNAIAFKVDKLKWSDGETAVDGNDADVVQRYPFQALMDATTLKTLRITRNPA